jgi:hypothetical protein
MTPELTLGFFKLEMLEKHGVNTSEVFLPAS